MNHTQNTHLRNTNIPVSDPEAGLRISEIFYSLQGEANTAGSPTVFVRLTGCPLRCVYCDTAYAFGGGERMSLASILQKVQSVANHSAAHVCVTGGEPLAQPNCLPLLSQLCDAGYAVSLETSGALSVAAVDKRVSKVMDLKTPSSGEVKRNDWQNLAYLNQRDQLKFVIMNREDYDWSKKMLSKHALHEKVSSVWFSPMFSIAPSEGSTKNTQQLPALASELAGWILADNLPVRLQLQLHKLLWADAQGK